MPIRRRDDGEIVEEPTAPVPGRGADKESDAATDPVESRAGREDSLFEARGDDERGAGRLDEPTVAMGAAQPDDERTRIVAPRRTKPGSDGMVEDLPDPMRDPPVGWLVVVLGPGKGHVLTLGNGMNVVGRGGDARVRIDFGDDTIARANHARVVYEPRQRRYLLNHGDGSNLTYLNGEVVMGSVEIASGAMIEIGETTLRFQAFCSEEFDWPDVDD